MTDPMSSFRHGTPPSPVAAAPSSGLRFLRPEGSLVLVMSAYNRSSFDFVGRYAGEDDQSILLKNPLALDYDMADAGNATPLRGLRPLHLPSGLVDVLAGDTWVSIPREGVGHAVFLPEKGTDWVHETYAAFFRQTPESA